MSLSKKRMAERKRQDRSNLIDESVKPKTSEVYYEPLDTAVKVRVYPLIKPDFKPYPKQEQTK